MKRGFDIQSVRRKIESFNDYSEEKGFERVTPSSSRGQFFSDSLNTASDEFIWGDSFFGEEKELTDKEIKRNKRNSRIISILLILFIVTGIPMYLFRRR